MLRNFLRNACCALLLLSPLCGAALAQPRNALVIGNGAYENAPVLKTPATDAAIVAETLQAAGYEVTELRDIRQAAIGQSMRTFLDKVAAGGPTGTAFVYYSGYAARSDGQNYLVPIDALINGPDDIADEAFRLNDLLDELAKTPLAARIVVLDASRDHKFGDGRKPVPKGLATAKKIPGMLLAYAAAPGAVSNDGDGDYSLYTGALVTQMRQPGFDMEKIVKNTRLEVRQKTDGAQSPWMVSALENEVRLFDAPNQEAAEKQPVQEKPQVQRRRSRDFDPGRAGAGIVRDILRHAPF